MKTRITFQEVLSGNVFTREWARKQYPVLVLVLVLLFAYVYAGIEAERRSLYLNELQKEQKDAHYELLTLQSELTDLTRQSSVARELDQRGSHLKENRLPAIRIDK